MTGIAIYRILAMALVILLVVTSVALWRLTVSHLSLLRRNRELYDLIVSNLRRENREIKRRTERAIEVRTPNQELYQRLCELMRKEQPYTNSELNRDALAAMLGTNHRYIDEAIRECTNGISTNSFINSYRVDHAARLLTETNESIALIAELSGFANRTSFNNLFRERFRMTPSEARRAIVSDKKKG